MCVVDSICNVITACIISISRIVGILVVVFGLLVLVVLGFFFVGVISVGCIVGIIGACCSAGVMLMTMLYGKKIDYTSRFVRVILAQGPC